MAGDYLMSNLLEEAIVDAAALRETALKSAEAALIEKYSQEFKQSVQKLLEQEAADPLMQDPTAAPTAAPELSTPSTTDLSAGIATQNAGAGAFDKIPSSFLDGDDDEVITIDFDQIKKQLAPEIGAMSGMETQTAPAPAPMQAQPELAPMQEQVEIDESLFNEMHDAGGHYEQGDDALYEEEWSGEDELEEGWHEEELELELEELSADISQLEEMGMSQDAAVQAAQKNLSDIEARSSRDAAQAKGRLAAAQGAAIEKQRKQETGEEMVEEVEEENISITSEELAELAEALKIDIEEEHQLRGYMGTTVTEKELARNAELAAARDDSKTEEREEELKAMSDLKEKLSESEKRNDKLMSLIEELKDNLISLKENTEKLSVSNAKLLYTNKVLGDSSLNERQKQQIVENISNASTVLEAKTIYGTLQSAVQNVSQKKPTESLSEALIRGNSPFLTRTKISSIEDNLSERMKILAGIKTKN